VDDAGRLEPVAVVVQHLSLPLLVSALVLAPDPVDRLAVGGGREPGAWVRRHAVRRPALDGGRERLGCRLLGDVEVTEAPRQSRDHPRPLLAVDAGDRFPGVDHRNGRTSTFRLQAFDPSAASSSATSRSGALMIQKPARYSFDSTNGPSVKIASPFRLSITVAVSGAPRPAAKTQWPSDWSRSLNSSMAAISSPVAVPVCSSITEIRYCMVTVRLLWLWGAPRECPSPLLRTRLPRSDSSRWIGRRV